MDWKTITDFQRIGHLGKTHGTSGELRFIIDDGMENTATTTPYLFVDILGSRVPFAVRSIRQTRDILIAFDGLESIDEVADLVGAEVFVPMDQTDIFDSADATDSLRFARFTGFDVYWDDRLIGEILEVREFPQQEMAVIEFEGRDILIPLHENLILRVEDQTLHMDLPEGLLDI